MQPLRNSDKTLSTFVTSKYRIKQNQNNFMASNTNALLSQNTSVSFWA